MQWLSAIYRWLIRGTDLEGVVPFDDLPPSVRDEVFHLASDMARSEMDARNLPPETRENLRGRFIRKHKIDVHPYARTVYWIARHLREEGRGLISRLQP